MEYIVEEHSLVPKHMKLEKEELEKLLHKYNIIKAQLPKISKKDPAIKNMDVKTGDVLKITRSSPTAGETIFYRVIVNE